MKKINSAGILFIHLLGTILDNHKIEIHQVNTYQNAFAFYQASKKLHEKMQDKVDIELYCILGITEKVEKISDIIKKNLETNFDRIIKEHSISLKDDNLDFLGNTFNRLVQEHIFPAGEIKYPRKRRIIQGEWIIDCFWGGENPEDIRY